MDLVLIVDDSLVQAHVLKKILETDYRVEICTSGQEAPERVRQLRPSLILLDLIMPQVDGFETLARLKQDADTWDIPVILITGLTSAGYEEQGLTLGAVDYIAKPYSANIVRARVRTHMELYTYRKAMERLALVDGLTGIPNRRYYDQRCREEWFRAMRHREPLSIGILDVDCFKRYNDYYGHQAGDGILKAVAQTCASVLKRTSDFFARYGGEEFGILMPATQAEQARVQAERICRSVRELRISHAGSEVCPVLTVSIGGTTVVPQADDAFDGHLQTADRMLYRAKDAGRNRVMWTA